MKAKVFIAVLLVALFSLISVASASAYMYGSGYGMMGSYGNYGMMRGYGNYYRPSYSYPSYSYRPSYYSTPLGYYYTPSYYSASSNTFSYNKDGIYISGRSTSYGYPRYSYPYYYYY